MPRLKYDGVIEAIRLTPEGNLAFARVYERRGAAFSDRILLSRDDLLQKIKSGKRFFAGQRIVYLGASFKTADPVRLMESDGKEILTTSVIPDSSAQETDDLKGIPLF